MSSKMKHYWDRLAQPYFADEAIRQSAFEDLWHRYHESHRHYHHAGHIEDLLTMALEAESYFEDPDVVAFAIWYHDVIYQSVWRDNEARSEAHARSWLARSSLSLLRRQKVSGLILATATHAKSQDSDTQLFLDMDLSVLAWPSERYRGYVRQIRKEYWLIPKLIFNKNRRLFLERMAASERIFQSDYFYAKCESAARRNIGDELAEMGGARS